MRSQDFILPARIGVSNWGDDGLSLCFNQMALISCDITTEWSINWLILAGFVSLPKHPFLTRLLWLGNENRKLEIYEGEDFPTGTRGCCTIYIASLESKKGVIAIWGGGGGRLSKQSPHPPPNNIIKWCMLCLYSIQILNMIWNLNLKK